MSVTLTVGAPFKIKYVSDTSKLPVAEEVGTLIVSSDGKIYKGNGASNPLLSLNDVILVESEGSLSGIVGKVQGKLYYTKDTSVLWTWDSVKFNKVSGGVETYDLAKGSIDILVNGVTLFGKPIYAAVIDTGILPTDVEKSKSVPHNVANIEYLYKIEGFAKDTVSAENNFLIMNSTPTSFLGNNAVAITADAQNIYLTCSIDFSRFNESTVILYYTKTNTE